METKVLLEINKIFLKFPQYWEGDKLLKSKVIEDLRSYNRELIEELLHSEVVKNSYTLNIKNSLVFKIEEFINMLRYKSYWENSYTKYSNEIGLTNENKYLNYNTDVVLDFPHKDCVLEGGMSSEELGKNEMFYHTILAREEIDTMFSPKVLTNVQKYNENGKSEIIEYTDSDNLILKGNNLIALHSLKKRYSNKVKLIYIDPPYNTGGDSFKYNDRFNHSTWLTFMKNRLEIAKELLSPDGSIWINIDDDESHYLKVLADSIFGRHNFIANIVWQKKYSPQNDAKYFSDMHDHILVYAKSKEMWKANLMPRTAAMDERYTNRDNDPRGPWKSSDFSVRTYSAENDYEITTPSGRIVKSPNGRVWGSNKKRFEELVKDNRIWFGQDGNNVPSVKKFLSEVKAGSTPTTAWLFEELYSDDGFDDFWNYEEVSHTQDSKREMIALDIDFATPKPEKLLQRIINIGSNEGELVLDFFMGSGTTQAVAMKMNRQFIGIEQMDYIHDVTISRLKKVIAGEQGGISTDVGWNGGGSFVYAELHKLNQKFIEMILEINSDEELIQFMNEIKEVDFLNYKVELDRLSKLDTDFVSLNLKDKKQLLIEVLDSNQLYLSYSEIDDEQYRVLETEKKFNHSFYNSNEGGH